jgi:putative membrane protein
MNVARVITTAALLLAGSLMLATAFAQDNRHAVSPEDKHFMSEAAEGGLAEVELGHLAAEKAATTKVRDLGDRMVRDHSEANDKLKDIARRLGVNVPDHLSATEYAEKTKLSALSGDHFDRAYVNDMLKDHRQDLAEFRREARDGQNPEVKAFASQTLPILEERLRLAEQTNRDITRQTSSVTRGGQ